MRVGVREHGRRVHPQGRSCKNFGGGVGVHTEGFILSIVSTGSSEESHF